ncbi:cytochrome c oxidase assembly protein COX11, mitochondrial [Cyclospora cayetanensis]|uniref:Cytochrome c oxidase assembly protein COX11, mitochondrial n=1 Tax=Cyclospora cayetanensis TaxID=88456 RepID=A0A6P6RXB5_9EIME|nr:cytochrome c oxidase assembly protein COX11, mitochondrial [Cyclospora cayetanensis]
MLRRIFPFFCGFRFGAAAVAAAAASVWSVPGTAGGRAAAPSAAGNTFSSALSAPYGAKYSALRFSARVAVPSQLRLSPRIPTPPENARGPLGGPPPPSGDTPPLPHLPPWMAPRKTSEEAAAARDVARAAFYCCCLFFGLCSVAFAFVPLYAAFCNQTGYGGAVGTSSHRADDTPIPSRQRNKTNKTDKAEILTIDFASHCNLPWTFQPLQQQIKVAPGESALAFYRAKNLTDKPIIGMSVYHVIPAEAGQYFNKIQCFCFEEQLLSPHEEVDMPVFFFIDPAILEDPRLEQMRHITLSYIFFESASEVPDEYKDLAIGLPIPQRLLPRDTCCKEL